MRQSSWLEFFASSDYSSNPGSRLLPLGCSRQTVETLKRGEAGGEKEGRLGWKVGSRHGARAEGVEGGGVAPKSQPGVIKAPPSYVYCRSMGRDRALASASLLRTCAVRLPRRLRDNEAFQQSSTSYVYILDQLRRRSWHANFRHFFTLARYCCCRENTLIYNIAEIF